MRVFAVLASSLVLVSAPAFSQNIVKVATDAGLTTLLDVVKLADVVGPLTNGKANLTVLAPTNQAFADLGSQTLDTLKRPYNKDLLRNILLYHVFGDRYPSNVILSLAGKNTPPSLEGSTHAVTVQNGNIFLGSARVISPNVEFFNGKKRSVVHVINRVLVPPTIKIPTNTITELVIALNNQGQFTLLFKALNEFGTTLTDLLASSSKRGLTVFAPTDDAFQDLPARYRTFPIRRKCRPALLKILQFHVVPRLVRSSSLFDYTNLRSVAGKIIDVERRPKNVFVDGAKIIQSDIRATNGIIHVIDEVMIPW